MMINGAVEVITASIVAGLTQHAALHPLDTLKAVSYTHLTLPTTD